MNSELLGLQLQNAKSFSVVSLSLSTHGARAVPIATFEKCLCLVLEGHITIAYSTMCKTFKTTYTASRVESICLLDFIGIYMYIDTYTYTYKYIYTYTYINHTFTYIYTSYIYNVSIPWFSHVFPFLYCS